MSKKSLIFISLLLFCSFVYFSYLVHRGTFKRIDFDTTVRLQNHIGTRWSLPFSIITLFGSAELSGLVVLILFILLVLKKSYKVAAALLLFLITLPIELYGKIFVYHPGPPFMFYKGVLNYVFPSSYVHSNYSYPSGHATRLSFIVVFLIILISLRLSSKSKWFLTLLLITFLVAVYVSRIYLGEHWLSDVVGGALLGSSLGILAGCSIPSQKRLI